MLEFLDALSSALAARDRSTIHRWLRHPLARALPRSVRAEALAIARAGTAGHLPPTRLLRFYFQTVQLASSTPAFGAGPGAETWRPPGGSGFTLPPAVRSSHAPPEHRRQQLP
jgi:hypothetical protein